MVRTLHASPGARWPFTVRAIVARLASCGALGGRRERGRRGRAWSARRPAACGRRALAWMSSDGIDARRWRAGRPRRTPPPTARRPPASARRRSRAPDAAPRRSRRCARPATRPWASRVSVAATPPSAKSPRRIGHLVQARAACAPATAEARSPSASSSGASAVVSAATKKSSAATVRRPRALRSVSWAPSATITAGSSAGRIGMREAAARACRACGSGRWPTKGMAWASSGQRSRTSVGALQRALPDEGADAQAAVGPGDHGGQRGHAIDVDHVARPGEAEVEHGHQALPAGQDLGPVAVAGEETERLLDRGGVVIAESGRLHRGSLGPRSGGSQDGDSVCYGGRQDRPDIPSEEEIS